MSNECGQLSQSKMYGVLLDRNTMRGSVSFFWLQHATFNRPVLVRPVKPAKERFLQEAQSSESHRVGLGEQYGHQPALADWFGRVTLHICWSNSSCEHSWLIQWKRRIFLLLYEIISGVSGLFFDHRSTLRVPHIVVPSKVEKGFSGRLVLRSRCCVRTWRCRFPACAKSW